MNDHPSETMLSPLEFVSAGPAQTQALQQAIRQCTAHSEHFNALVGAAPRSEAEQWALYWQARAQNTPLTRRALAVEHFLGHVRASHDYTLSSGAIDADRLKAVTGVLANPEWLRLGHQQLIIEIPVLGEHAVPGALLFAVEGEAQCVLYRPGEQPAFSAHDTRQALEAHVSARLESAPMVSYLTAESLTAGFDTLLAGLLRTPLATGAPVLAAPPPLDDALEHDSPVSLHDFGSLTADVPPDVAAWQVQRQLALLQPFADNQAPLIDHQRAVQAARDTAGKAIERRLQGTEALAELAAAQHAGLRAHARFQHLVGDISDTELAWVESLLTQGEAFPGPEALTIAAHPLLYRPLDENEETGTDRQLIEGALVITHRAALDRDNTDHALLLYWPGEHGGLLRCANRSVLEHCLGAAPQSGLAVGLSPVHGDVLSRLTTYYLERTAQAATSEHGAGAEAGRHDELMRLSLQVPRHAAREAALEALAREQHSANLAAALPDWLARIPTPERLALRTLIEQYPAAMRRSQGLLARDLPHRSLFCWQRINRRLVQDFDGYDGTPVTLDLPLTTARRKDPIAGSGAPGVPSREVLVASSERERLSLEDLLLANLDAPMIDRLGFVRVDCPVADPRVREALTHGIDTAYLQRLATELDLAQAYEDCILASYRGLEDNAYAAQYRRECLVEPWRLSLQVQSILAGARGRLQHDGRTILGIALDADSADRYSTGQHDIRLLGVQLSAGGADTAEQPTPLSGVTLVNDVRSGITLLYLPEHPTQPLAQYPNLDAARLGVYELAKQNEGLDYLAGRALLGDPDAHRSRLRQAVDQGFEGVIAVGSAWPASVSLAHRLLDAQMGRVITAHRATSRSNRDLWLENFAYQSGMVFNYLKMALGFVPVVGTVIGLYDFFTATYSAAKALVEGQGERAMDELEQALSAFIDAAMDLAPGVAVAVNASAARRLSRQRPAARLAGVGPASRLRLARFSGYEHPAPLSLVDLQPATQGRFNAVYRHAEGDFILIDDRPCQVQWDDTAHTWRLAGTPRQGWRRAVALDAHGRWDTHMALYGTHLQGGGAGGGQALGHLADQLDPYWPATIRDRLPRFWVDRVYRRQRALQHQALVEEQQLQASLARSNEAFARFDGANDSDRLAMVAELEQRTRADVDQGTRVYDTWDGLQQLSRGRNRQRPMLQKTRAATVVGDRLVHLLELKARRSRQRLVEMGAIHLRITQTDDFAQQLPWWREMRHKAIEHLAERERMFEVVEQLNTWHTRGESTSTLRRVHDHYQHLLNAEFREAFSTQHLMHAVQRFEDAGPSAAFLTRRLNDSHEALTRAATTLLDMHEAKASAPQRRQIQAQARRAYLNYKRRLQSTQATLPTLFEEPYLTALHDNLDALITRAERTLRRTPGDTRPSAGASTPRVFQTVEGQLYVGDYLPATTRHPGYMVMRGDTGAEIGRFVNAGEYWQRQPAPRPVRPGELAELRTIAARLTDDLDSYRTRIEVYQRQGMLAADLEHMMVIKAEDLESCARRLAELDGAAVEPMQLLVHARQLRAQGKALRVAQIKRSAQPNEGHLAYLLEQQQVELQRLQGRQRLKATDHLQEYAVLDLGDTSATPLWYAHFHYRDAQTPFEQFSAAHLKLAADRYRGPEWQQAQPVHVAVWRGPISRQVASTLFANL